MRLDARVQGGSGQWWGAMGLDEDTDGAGGNGSTPAKLRAGARSPKTTSRVEQEGAPYKTGTGQI